MMMWTFVTSQIHQVWTFLFGWAGIDILIGFAAVAVAVCETWIINSIPPPFNKLVPDLRKWAIVVAVIAFSLTGAIAYGYKNGMAEVQGRWDAAVFSEIKNGEKSRTDAESAVRNEPPDSVRNDPRNRDNWGKQPDKRTKGPVRWLESHRFFGKQR